MPAACFLPACPPSYGFRSRFIQSAICAATTKKEQTGFFAAFAVCLSAAVGIALSANLLTFFVFFEILTIATYPLVFHSRTPEAKFSGRKYLIYTLTSGQLFLVGIVIVYVLAGTLDFQAGGFLTADMAPAGALCLLFFFLVVAGAVKAGVMPLHGWLPSAMVAPTPVSALLHAVAVVKAGAFCVIRIVGYVFGPELFGGDWLCAGAGMDCGIYHYCGLSSP